jgi:hypothetical protein
MERERKPPAPDVADDPLEPSAEETTGEHAPAPAPPGENLAELDDRDD